MAKRKIRAKDIVADVNAGMNDRELLQKYSITPEVLQYIFRQLVQAGLISDMDFYERTRLTESDVFRAFSDEPEGSLKCPSCGQPLPENGEDCVFCKTMEGGLTPPVKSVGPPHSRQTLPENDKE